MMNGPSTMTPMPTPVKQPVGGARGSGTIAVSPDGRRLWVVDTDNALVAVVDTEGPTLVRKVPVGRTPGRVVVGVSGKAFVASRAGDVVTVVPADPSQPTVLWPVAPEPMDLVLSSDERTLFVVSALSRTHSGTGAVTALELPSGTRRWRTEVGVEPRAATLLGQGARLLVGHGRTGDLWELDAATGAVLVRHAVVPESPGFVARSLTQVASTPAHDRAFAAITWARTTPLVSSTATSIPPNYSGGRGPCGGGAATAGLVTLNALTSQARVLPLVLANGCTPRDDYPQPVMPQGQGPSAMVVDGTGRWLVTTYRESAQVAITRAASGARVEFNDTRPGVDGLGVVTRGEGPGQSLEVWTYSQFDHTLQRQIGSGTSGLLRQGELKLADDTLPASVVAGRRLFFDARSPASTGSGMSCATCHPDGREDGHVWAFPEGPRRTPSLSGRSLVTTGPWHWGGEVSTMGSLMRQTIVTRMGGTGLASFDVDRLLLFLESLPPSRPVGDPTSLLAMTGRLAFEKAGCEGCHSGATLSGSGIHDVGTLLPGDRDLDRTDAVSPDCATAPDGGACGFNVPSLRGLSRSAPYLHGGQVPTLEALLATLDSTSRHGSLEALTAEERQALLVYLRSL
jgi:YVTN family beta-propeller protein